MRSPRCRLLDQRPLGRFKLVACRMVVGQVQSHDRRVFRRVHRDVQRGVAIEGADLDDFAARLGLRRGLSQDRQFDRLTLPKRFSVSTRRIGEFGSASDHAVRGSLVTTLAADLPRSVRLNRRCTAAARETGR